MLTSALSIVSILFHIISAQQAWTRLGSSQGVNTGSNGWGSIGATTGWTNGGSANGWGNGGSTGFASMGHMGAGVGTNNGWANAGSGNAWANAGSASGWGSSGSMVLNSRTNAFSPTGQMGAGFGTNNGMSTNAGFANAGAGGLASRVSGFTPMAAGLGGMSVASAGLGVGQRVSRAGFGVGSGAGVGLQNSDGFLNETMTCFFGSSAIVGLVTLRRTTQTNAWGLRQTSVVGETTLIPGQAEGAGTFNLVFTERSRVEPIPTLACTNENLGPIITGRRQGWWGLWGQQNTAPSLQTVTLSVGVESQISLLDLPYQDLASYAGRGFALCTTVTTDMNGRSVCGDTGNPLCCKLGYNNMEADLPFR